MSALLLGIAASAAVLFAAGMGALTPLVTVGALAVTGLVAGMRVAHSRRMPARPLPPLSGAFDTPVIVRAQRASEFVESHDQGIDAA